MWFLSVVDKRDNERKKEIEQQMIKNAIIKSTMLGREDHGIMTFMIFVKFDDMITCGIGGWALDQYDENIETRVFQAKSMEVISKILEVIGVKTWEELPGKYIRFEDAGRGETITKIGNIIEDKWLDIREFLLSEKEKNNK